MRRVYILPNLFTTGNLFCGLMALFETIKPPAEANLVLACQLIFVAGAFDVLDGVVARLTRSESDFGLNYDSADFNLPIEGRFKETKRVILLNSQTWQTATFHLSDAYFGNRQHNNFSDFRIWGESNNLCIDKVTVYVGRRSP